MMTHLVASIFSKKGGLFFLLLVFFFLLLSFQDFPDASSSLTTFTIAVEEYMDPIEVEDEEQVYDVEEGDELEEDAFIAFEPSFLNQVQCIPLVCSAPKHFISSPTMKEFILLSSFPGSGNTWVRSIVEEGTRIYSGSVYYDKKLYVDGFKGERIDSLLEATSKVSVIKTHYPVYARSSAFDQGKVTAVIQILRNPFDALLAEFNREFGVKGSHSSNASPTDFKRVFPQWFLDHAQLWQRYVRYWVGIRRRMMTEYLQERDDSNGVSSYLLFRNFSVSTPKVPVLVLFYEDFLHRLDATAIRLFSFLNARLKNQVPSVLESVICAVQKRLTQEKRAHAEEEYSPFLDRESAQSLVPAFCNASAPIWFQEKWGDCMDTTPQATHPRHPIVPSPVFPKEPCLD